MDSLTSPPHAAGSPPHGQDQRSSRGYRADIDGLRSFAVLPIVIFHLGVSLVPGGYVGVDIFFVISGYLIGGIILSQISRGSYSIADFYIRRFRRIIPALAATLAITTIAMLAFALPGALVDYGKSLVATALFASNLYFWKTSDYFAPAADAQPLLHTWSLAVEEQYYLLFPILMLIVARFSRKAIPFVVAAATLLSLGLSAYSVFDRPVPTFYLLPTRIWELLLGVLAVEARMRLLDRRIWRELTAAAGLILIVLPILIYTSSTPFPGLSAVPPCLGTAMLLLSGAHGQSAVSRLLAFPPLVFFGLISYSLYLWHWPVVVILRQWLPSETLTPALQLFAFGLSVLLAWLSWRIVERPWRNPARSPRVILVSTAVVVILASAVGGALVLFKGIPQRFSPQVQRIAAMTNDASSNTLRTGHCFLSSGYGFKDFDHPMCLRLDPTKPNVLLLGDSHAAHLWSGLNERFPQLNLLQATASGCAPVLPGLRPGTSRCLETMTYLFGDYLNTRPVDWIILAGYWDESYLTQVAETLDNLHARGFKVILAGPVVRYHIALPQALAMATMRNNPALVDDMRETEMAGLDRKFEAIARRHGAIYFSPYQALCEGTACRTTGAHGLPLQYDYGHLTAEGSLLVASRFPASVILRERQSHN